MSDLPTVLIRRAAADLRDAGGSTGEYVARWLDNAARDAECGRVDVNALGLARVLDENRTYPPPATAAERSVRDMAVRLGLVSGDE